MKKAPGSSQPSRMLPASLHHQLNLYALAASAAGVSLLALAPPSEAKIVYTKTHHVIGQNSIYPLDLNHDGNIDFLIREWGNPGTGSGSNGVWVKEGFGNAVEGNTTQLQKHLAAALRKGALIGPRKGFVTSAYSFGEALVVAGCSVESGCSTYGKWRDVNNRYLGLKFQIHGKTHYGWARLSVQLQQNFQITATLTGYAYEIIPGKGIRAGQTGGQADDATSKPDSGELQTSPSIVVRAVSLKSASLGQFALGAAAVPVWRRP